MTHKEFVAERIKKRVEQIKEECEGSTLYGVPVDVDNADELVLCAYYLGREHQYEEDKEE